MVFPRKHTKPALLEATPAGAKLKEPVCRLYGSGSEWTRQLPGNPGHGTAK
jgi:hypothetical protein